jgi:uncharacterized protein with predicted RNA binding PUA domain
MDDFTRLRTVADYQFGAGAGTALFPSDGSFSVRHSRTGRPQQIFADGERLVSYGTDGRFTLGLAGGERLRTALAAPQVRVVVGAESDPFVREGKNAFAKFVHDVDRAVRPGDAVCIVGPDDDLFGVGQAMLSADAMAEFETGVAVKTREGAATTE